MTTTKKTKLKKKKFLNKIFLAFSGETKAKEEQKIGHTKRPNTRGHILLIIQLFHNIRNTMPISQDPFTIFTKLQNPFPINFDTTTDQASLSLSLNLFNYRQI